MAITVKDIAKICDLSLSTVIHILGNRGHRYRPETRERVLAVAQRRGYRPNTSARAMRKGRFDCVALLMSSTNSTRSNLFPSALKGICDALDKHNLHLTLVSLPDEKLINEGFMPKILREWMADGLLINYNTAIPQRMIQLIRDYAIPCVWMRSKHAGNCIYPDEKEAGREATNYLLKLGHSRIAYVDYTQGAYNLSTAHFGVLDCEAGYSEAMQNAGFNPWIIREADYVPREVRPARFMTLLTQPKRPTAIVAYASSAAWPAVYAAIQLGWKLPDDLSVITFSYQVENLLGQTLTTMLTPEYELGQQAVELLMERIINPGSSLPPRALKFKLAEGNSCAPPPAAI